MTRNVGGQRAPGKAHLHREGLSGRELGPCRCPQESGTSSGMPVSPVPALSGGSIRARAFSAWDEEQRCRLPWQCEMLSSRRGQYLALLKILPNSAVTPPPMSHPCCPRAQAGWVQSLLVSRAGPGPACPWWPGLGGWTREPLGSHQPPWLWQTWQGHQRRSLPSSASPSGWGQHREAGTAGGIYPHKGTGELPGGDTCGHGRAAGKGMIPLSLNMFKSFFFFMILLLFLIPLQPSPWQPGGAAQTLVPGGEISHRS